MPMSAFALTGAALSLGSAAVWGGGDFCGGLAARTRHPAAVVTAAGVSGSILLLVLALLVEQPWPSGADLGWSFAAGIAGAVGLGALYRALAIGDAAVVAPTAAVVGAMMPVGFGLLAATPPGMAQLAGFVLAATGIALVTRNAPGGARTRHGLATAAAAGVALGGFLVLMAQVGPEAVFLPLLAARVVMLAAAAAVLIAHRPVSAGGRAGLALALVAGLLDATGNALYLAATHYARIDVAGVLASLYPVSTVVLSRVLLRQQVRPVQWAGVATCAAAVTLIAG